MTCPDIPKLLIILRVSAWAWLSMKHMQVVLHFAGMDLCWCRFQILLLWNSYCKHRFVMRGCFVNIKVFPWYSNWYFSFLIKHLFLPSLINGSLFCFGIHVKFLSIHYLKVLKILQLIYNQFTVLGKMLFTKQSGKTKHY